MIFALLLNWNISIHKNCNTTSSGFFFAVDARLLRIWCRDIVQMAVADRWFKMKIIIRPVTFVRDGGRSEFQSALAKENIMLFSLRLIINVTSHHHSAITSWLSSRQVMLAQQYVLCTHITTRFPFFFYFLFFCLVSFGSFPFLFSFL